MADIATGFFNISVINKVFAADTLEEAKSIAMLAIDAQPNAKPHNINKARAIVNAATTKDKLLLSMSNFMLAHPSENLGMNK